VTAEAAAHREREELVSAVSHELKQPVSIIFGTAELLAQPNADPEKMRGLALTIHDETARLNRLLNDLLDLQRIGSGALRCQFEALDLRQVVQEALQTLGGRPTRHAFHLDVPESLPAVRGDRVRLRQVLANLISNAVKYSPAGNDVWIAAERQRSMIRVSVSDEGMGIPAAALSEVFAPFYRAEAAEQASVPGHGLGLAIAKSIVELHGGQIDVSSTPGKGSTFFFTLPVASPAARRTVGSPHAAAS
jgi:signal transduction histidine kinase